jgi:hypothetical protein
MLEMSSVFTSARLDKSDYGLWHPFIGPGAVANGFTDITKRVGEVSLHFQLELKPLRIEVGRKWGPCIWSCCFTLFIMIGIIESIPRKQFTDIC